MTLATPPFGKIFGGRVRTVPGKNCVKFEVRSLTVFELLAFNSHDRPLRTHKQTHIERTHYLRHSLRSLGGDNNDDDDDDISLSAFVSDALIKHLLACLAEVKARRVHLCRVAGDTV